jgi:hypothetical protein
MIPLEDLDAAIARTDGKAEWAGGVERWDYPTGTWYRYRSFYHP